MIANISPSSRLGVLTLNVSSFPWEFLFLRDKVIIRLRGRTLGQCYLDRAWIPTAFKRTEITGSAVILGCFLEQHRYGRQRQADEPYHLLQCLEQIGHDQPL